jgi:hypothetical protein
MRYLPTLALAVVALGASCSDGVAHMSLVTGNDRTRLYFIIAENYGTEADARSAAMNRCRTQGLANCAFKTSFSSTCLAIAVTPDSHFTYASGIAPDRARANAQEACFAANGTSAICTIQDVVCDGSLSAPGLSVTAIALPSDLWNQLYLALAFVVFFGIIFLGAFHAQVSSFVDRSGIRVYLKQAELHRQTLWRHCKLLLQQAASVQKRVAAARLPVAATNALAASPPDKIFLKLRRSQKTSFFGNPLFVLDARMEISKEAQEYLQVYQLGGLIIYESAASERRRAAAQEHLEESHNPAGIFASAGEQAKGILWMFWKLGRAVLSLFFAAWALRITIDKLLNGVHIECRTMDELLDAEQELRKAAENLKAYLGLARTFTGTEEVVEL